MAVSARVVDEGLDLARIDADIVQRAPVERLQDENGGFVLWLELPKPVNTRALFDAALAEGICFAPGDVFSAAGRYRNCLRLSCAHPWNARIAKGVATLGALASA